MAKSFLTDIQLNNNVLLNAKIQAWGSAPTGTTNPNGSGTAVAGQISSYLGDLYIFTGASGTPANTWSRVGNTLSDSTSTTSSTTGASSTAVKAAYDLAAAALPKSGGIMSGAIAMGTNNISGGGTFTATTFVGALTGNASTATTASATTGTLTFGTGLTAGGSSFNGSANITITPVSATTSVAGIVQLSDSTSTTSSTLAATATAAKAAYDRGSLGVTNAATAQSTADAALPKAGGIMTGFITTHADPTSDLHVANKRYVDTVSAGINVHEAVKYATTGALGTAGNLVGGTITTTYANGTSGLDATITVATSSNWTAITIDGQSLTVTDRVLIKNQGDSPTNSALQNGIYTVTQVGAVGNTTSFIFKRAVDNDQSPEIDAGDLTYVVAGTANGGDGYVQTTANVTVGTTSIVWTQFSGAGAVPLATISSVGIASFPTAQFSVDGNGAVTIGTVNPSVVNNASSGQISGARGGTGVDNTGKTITLGGNLTTTTAAISLAANASGSSVTLPLSGTLATLTGTEALTGKTVNGVTLTALTTGFSVAGGTTSKTLTVTETMTLTGSGVSGQTFTFPSSSATIARTDAAQSFTGTQTFTTIQGTVGSGLTLNTATASTNNNRSISLSAGSTSYAAGPATGGDVSLAAGNATGNNTGLGSSGGAINITAGNSTTATDGTGGDISLTPGTGAGGNGSVVLNRAVKLPNVQSGTAGFVKIAATTGLLSTATIAYSDLPTSSLTGVTTDGVARKKTGTLTANSSTTAFAINHAFGQWVTAQVFDASGNLVEVDVLNASTSNGTTTFTFAVAPTTGTDYKYVIVG